MLLDLRLLWHRTGLLPTRQVFQLECGRVFKSSYLYQVILIKWVKKFGDMCASLHVGKQDGPLGLNPRIK